MKTKKGLIAILILTLSTFISLGWYPSEMRSSLESGGNVIVLLKFTTQPDKGAVAVSELNDLLNKVKTEPHFVSIKLHVDPNDDTNVLLYEEWEDASYYNNEHMNTAHIKEFMENSINFLAGPPEITFWEVKSVFK